MEFSNERLNLVNNFETILLWESSTKRDTLKYPYYGTVELANITFAQMKEFLAKQPSINQYQELKEVKETFEDYTTRLPNKKCAGISLKQIPIPNPKYPNSTPMINDYHLHFVAHFNQNLLKSLGTSKMFEICLEFQSYIEENRLGKWCKWEHNPSSHSFKVSIGSVKGALNDDETFDIYKKIEHELDAINFILDGRKNLRARFALNIFGMWRKHKQSLNIVSFVSSPQPPLLKLSSNSILQALFENDATKDISIIVDAGVKIKAHKYILGAHSNVFETMLSTKMKEGSSGIVHIDDISESAMSKLIRYFYGMEIPTLELNCATACELFQAAHEYKLQEIETAISALFLLKDEKWFTVNFALGLYFYSNNNSDNSEAQNLNNHLLKILSRFPSVELRGAEKFKELPTSEMLELTFKLIDILRLGK